MNEAGDLFLRLHFRVIQKVYHQLCVYLGKCTEKIFSLVVYYT